MKNIFWDIDDVLNNLMLEFVNDYNTKNSTSHNYNDIKKNPPNNILGITEDCYKKELDSFRLSKYLNLQPNREIMKWFQKNGDNFQHIVITSAPLKTVHLSFTWLVENYGRWFRAFNFLPAYRSGADLPIIYNDKNSILELYKNVDYYIDDNPTNVDAALRLGINALLFPAPWNKNADSTINSILLNLK